MNENKPIFYAKMHNFITNPDHSPQKIQSNRFFASNSTNNTIPTKTTAVKVLVKHIRLSFYFE
jgi:hypothetical protein